MSIRGNSTGMTKSKDEGNVNQNEFLEEKCDTLALDLAPFGRGRLGRRCDEGGGDG